MVELSKFGITEKTRKTTNSETPIYWLDRGAGSCWISKLSKEKAEAGSPMLTESMEDAYEPFQLCYISIGASKLSEEEKQEVKDYLNQHNSEVPKPVRGHLEELTEKAHREIDEKKEEKPNAELLDETQVTLNHTLMNLDNAYNAAVNGVKSYINPRKQRGMDTKGAFMKAVIADTFKPQIEMYVTLHEITGTPLPYGHK